MSDVESNASSSQPQSPTTDDSAKGVKFQEPDQFAGLNRKERKKLEAQLQRQAELEEMQKEASRGQNIVEGDDSPFMVTLEQDATNEGSRNISLNQVSVSVTGKTLFRDTTVKFSAGSRYGVMGPNGRGKSTLLRLLAARELPVQKSLSMLLVEQEQEISGGDLNCVEAVIRSHKLQTEYMDEVEALRAMDESKMSDEQLERLNFLEEELVHMGASQAESKARKILYGLGFPTEWHERATSSFSGGWRKRIALASAVYIEPDLLMLDEPTNHLDLNAVIWLESYLVRQYNSTNKRPKALLVVSHDAGFLDGICTHMVAIENFKLNYYRGGFSGFNAQVEQRHAQIDKQYEQMKKLIAQKKRDGWTNDKVDGWLKDQVQSGKVDPEILDKRREYKVSFPFKTPAELRDGCIVKLEDVAFQYPGNNPTSGEPYPVLFKDVNCSLWSDSRVTLCGPNGIGKSTLLNLMTGLLKPTEGYITVNRQVRIGRYNQHFIDKLPLERTPVDYLISLGCRDEFHARAVLGSFGLEGLVHNNMVATLSGGQKARVALAGISQETPHFLLMDEPTNHLDMESIQALCDAINNFKGGILVVTHDSRLIQETNMSLWIANDRNVKPFKGTLEDYKDHVRAVYEDSEEQKEFARIQGKLDKANDKALLKETKGDVEAMEKLKAEKKAAAAAAADDFFGAMDTKKEKSKKEKKDKKDKKEKKEKKDGSDDGESEPSSPKEKKEKKSKKDKSDDLADALAEAAEDKEKPEKEKKKKEKKDKKDKA